MIYDVDFKSKQLVGIDKKDHEKRDYTPVDEMENDPVFTFVKEHLSIDQYELYVASVRHYLNCLFIKDPDEWIKVNLGII